MWGWWAGTKISASLDDAKQALRLNNSDLREGPASRLRPCRPTTHFYLVQLSKFTEVSHTFVYRC